MNRVPLSRRDTGLRSPRYARVVADTLRFDGQESEWRGAREGESGHIDLALSRNA